MYKTICGLIIVVMVAGCGSESKRLQAAGWENVKYGDYYLKQQPPDGPRALRLYERGATQTNDRWAQFQAAELLSSGKYGVPKNEQKAVYYYNLASQQGVSWASYRLALAYKSGEGVSANRDEAIKFARLAYSQSSASNKYADMLLYDLLKDSKPDEANKYLAEAGKAGDERAKKILSERGAGN